MTDDIMNMTLDEIGKIMINNAKQTGYISGVNQARICINKYAKNMPPLFKRQIADIDKTLLGLIKNYSKK